MLFVNWRSIIEDRLQTVWIYCRNACCPHRSRVDLLDHLVRIVEIVEEEGVNSLHLKSRYVAVKRIFLAFANPSGTFSNQLQCVTCIEEKVAIVNKMPLSNLFSIRQMLQLAQYEIAMLNVAHLQ